MRGTWSLIPALLLVASACIRPEPSHDNVPPDRPRICPPPEIYVGHSAEFEILVSDRNGDDVGVFVAWGDGDTSKSPDFVRSQASVTLRHSYGRQGQYGVTGRCVDPDSAFSDWSDAHVVMVLPQR